MMRLDRDWLAEVAEARTEGTGGDSEWRFKSRVKGETPNPSNAS